jgi:hypothetical protein
MQMTVCNHFHISTCLGYSDEFFRQVLLSAGLFNKRGLKAVEIGPALGLIVEFNIIKKRMGTLGKQEKQRWIRIRGVVGEPLIPLNLEELAAQPEHERAVQYFDEYWYKINNKGVQRDKRVTPRLVIQLKRTAAALEQQQQVQVQQVEGEVQHGSMARAWTLLRGSGRTRAQH